jgi:glycosyltransferase involved in cell wall biosynthesis
MPTLLSINNYYYPRGGAETVFFEQNRLFEEKSWRVAPFAMRHPKNLQSAYERFFIDEIEFGGDYSLVQKLVRVPKVIYSWEARRKLASLIDEVRPDVAHGHNIYHHISPSILGLLRQRGIPTVLTLHDLKIACPAYNMLAPDGICERCKGGRLHNVVRNRCIKNSLPLSAIVFAEAVVHRMLGSYSRCVDRLVVPSRFYLEKLCSWGFPRSQFVHVPNFVDLKGREPAYSDDGSFLYFGRLSREKGVATLIRAAARADVTLRIAGTGPQLDELQALASRLGKRVEFLGHLGGASLAAALSSARAVVLPSEWYENAPMSVLEAYGVGKPVLGADIGGIPELIRHDTTGWTFPSGDVEALAQLIGRVAGMTPASIHEMGRAGRHWVETEFTASCYQARVAELYAELGVRGPET